jgi:cell division protein FtsQ
MRRKPSWALRVLGRVGGLAILGVTIFYGLVQGEHLDERANIPGKVAGYFGYAADDIRILGLRWQAPSAVLAAIGVRRNGPLIGFEPVVAKRILENLDWVKSAHVQRLFPNQLEIRIVEREPFAVWQRDGIFYVIDKTGTAITSVAPEELPAALVVTGEGAQTASAELVNQLEAHPALRSLVRAAARVGDRRWNLYCRGNVKVILPESGVEGALKVLAGLQSRRQVLDRHVAAIDLRLAESVVFTPVGPKEDSKDEVKMSRR